MNLRSASSAAAFIAALLRAAAVGASLPHLGHDHSSPFNPPYPAGKFADIVADAAAAVAHKVDDSNDSVSQTFEGGGAKRMKVTDASMLHHVTPTWQRRAKKDKEDKDSKKKNEKQDEKLEKEKEEEEDEKGSVTISIIAGGGAAQTSTTSTTTSTISGVADGSDSDGEEKGSITIGIIAGGGAEQTSTTSTTTSTISSVADGNDSDGEEKGSITIGIIAGGGAAQTSITSTTTSTISSVAAGPGISDIAQTSTTSTTTSTRTSSNAGGNDSDGEGTAITYRPGDLTVQMEELLLSTGLKARTIAREEEYVPYANGDQSSRPFHRLPDFGGTFLIPDSLATKKTKGGWVYVSNSEIRAKDGNPEGLGGVGAITFNSAGDVVEYKMVLTGTTANCGGGKTSWNTWITCEENGKSGQCHEVDPYGKVKGRVTVLGGNGGNFESFAYDDREKSKPRFFVTHDKSNGELRRFTPNNAGVKPNNRLLHESGTMEYLVLTPDKKDKTIGKYSWTTSIATGKTSAFAHFKNVEGIDVSGSRLYFVSKAQMEMFTLDLDHDTYSKSSTVRGKFDGQPDQVSSIVSSARGEILYFTEDTKKQAGVHGRDDQGRYYTILESHILDKEVTGLAFSPDQKHMYVAYQKEGILFDVYREDGRPFSGKTLNIRYHEV
uniref:SMP-30/Gluconolactonase/LRE-like region domain-containing protein n=1 Tax=Odontella aurita TaxID=265563 RepID=A0A7S4I3Q9_9STRA|mmetsp:Transcript_19264/g.56178  ORF Transcript_19264/g.56178 Transcript_19264/m.56178 type:complete len:663 (+) Transcript_19264:72-2060(+)